MHLRIRPLDPTSEAELDQYLALDRALDEHTYGGSQLQTRDQLRADLQESPYWAVLRRVPALATSDGRQGIGGSASAFKPQLETLETHAVGAPVLPAFRARGIATTMVQEALIPAICEFGRPLVEA